MRFVIIVLWLFIAVINAAQAEKPLAKENPLAANIEQAKVKQDQQYQQELQAKTPREQKLIALLAQQSKVSQVTPIKHLTAKIAKLQDSTGLVYIGAAINKVELTPYLNQLKKLLGKPKYQVYRANQAARDQQSFHVTLINPFEYQKMNKEKVAKHLGKTIRLTLYGLGKVAIDNATKPEKNATSYFVVVSSADGQFFRQQYLLKPKNFHITLGFDPHDIYNMSKGKERLIEIKQQ